MLYRGENTQVHPVYSVEEEQITIPTLLFEKDNPEEVKAIEYAFDGKHYYFSNKEGHKVYSYDKRSHRPMTKREFKKACTNMLDNLDSYGEQSTLILSEIENLDFSLGHANSTFEVVCSCSGLSKIGALALNNNDLYLITNNAQLVKLNAKTGEIIYSKYFNTTLKSGLTFCNNKLFFTTDNNETFAINPSNGEKEYIHKTIEESSSFIKGSTPACKDDKLITTFSNGEVHMIMADTSTAIWLDSAYKINTSNINNISDIIANPVINKDTVIVKSYNDITKAFNINDGSTIWITSNGGKTTPIISNNIMFDIDNNKIVFASNAITGNKIWETKLEIDKNDIFFDPLLINNQLIIPVSNGDLIKVNPYNGQIIETENLTSKIDVSPIVINDKLIIISNGDLEVFN